MALATLILLATATLTNAHFSIEYPEWRANTLATNTSYSQWLNPCGGVPANVTSAPRTAWPLTGGSLKLDLHHPWTYIFVNLGLGSAVSNFNYTLTNPFWNETGNGTLCVPQLALPAGLPIQDGSNASLQVVTLGADGNALYNCADIVFRANATVLSSNCTNDQGVSVQTVSTAAGTNGSAGGNGSSSGSGGKNAAPGTGVSLSVMSSVVALTVLFVMGMSV